MVRISRSNERHGLNQSFPEQVLFLLYSSKKRYHLLFANQAMYKYQMPKVFGAKCLWLLNLRIEEGGLLQLSCGS